MCVFFFKQKTAYEMRISDWSSDVCSSDLLLLRLGAVLAEALLLTRRVLLLSALGIAPLGSTLTVAGRLPPLHVGRPEPRRHRLLLAIAPQIGRASCRERVCPYV